MSADTCGIIGTVDKTATTTKRVAGRRRTGQRAWRSVFLEAVANGNTIGRSAEIAGVARSTVYEHRVMDPEFAFAWDTAYDAGGDAIVQEAYRRGVEGIEHKHFDKEGNLLWTEVRYSDRMLELLLKQRRPAEFRERYTVDARTTVRDERVGAIAARDPEIAERISALIREQDAR